MIDFTNFSNLVPIILFIIYALFEMKRTGTTIFVLKFYTIFDIVITRLKMSTNRQPFQVGFINTDKINEDILFEKLISVGYQWDYFAYHDEGEIISMRKLYENRQIHVRIFKDEEITMHDELNYEFDPIGHLKIKAIMPAPEAVKEVLIKFGQ